MIPLDRMTLYVGQVVGQSHRKKVQDQEWGKFAGEKRFVTPSRVY